MRRCLFLVSLCSGCFPRAEPGDDSPVSDTDTDTDADTDTDTDADTDVDPGDARLDAVAPADGSTRGGTEVTLSGSGFTPRTQVWFDDEEADVIDVGTDELVVEAPTHAAGDVTVSVGTGSATDSLARAFTYWPDHSDNTELMVLWAYLESYDGTGNAYGLAYPVTPGDYAFSDLWGPTLDACDGASAVDTTTWGSSFTVTDEYGGRYTLASEGGGYTYSGTESGSEFTAGADYGVEGVASSANPAFETDLFFDTPSAFSVTSPSIGSGYDLYFSGDDMDVSWTGSGGDFVLVWFYGTDNDDTLYCVARDDGDFTVDSSYLSRFSSLEFVQISVARFRVSEAVLSHDNGVVLGAGMYQFTGFVQVY